ncbi:hypothetical protein [Actinomadura rupiterrae]|uniref:hypothetical protein n=1 Tax=Actinomadura rupiterrae TaxID=559627 RepID=UPI0020A49005|nr:hypothetical protein [Actinomadura rupiterrae]MCP2339157.1 hypothetical protein [Actinomadura rupiterrae]
MSIPVPLGVRIINNYQDAWDIWVTNAVQDITFRSVVPGGFASATIRLHRPAILAGATGYLYDTDAGAFERVVRLFNRVQIVDLRDASIVWEGRIEDPKRNSADDTWEVGCLGAMVAASDVQRPIWYADSDVQSWVPRKTSWWQASVDTVGQTIEIRWAGGYSFALGTLYTALDWRRGQECEQFVARYDITFSGVGATSASGGSGTAVNLWNSVDVISGYSTSAIDIDATNYTQNIRHTRYIGAAYDHYNPTGGISCNDGWVMRINMGKGSGSGAYITPPDAVLGRISRPHVYAVRMDRYGNSLTASSNYTTDYVTLPQIVEDVVGRLLVGGWFQPWGSDTGQVRASDIWIDYTSARTWTHLTYFDGATAADILNDMVAAEPTAYWALWESRYGATDQNNDQNINGFRFEWATWPASWGYQATSADGLEEQPNGSDLRNEMFYKFTDSADWDSANSGLTEVLPESDAVPELDWAKLTRAITVIREEPTDPDTPLTEMLGILQRYGKVRNAGTLTVRRPIPFYDKGVNSWTGASRMVQPWEIRPGKLIRITDLLPSGRINDFSHGTTAPPPEHNGTVWRVVATEYNSADNSCRLELDQVASWQLATQIADAAAAPAPNVKKG